MTLIDASAHRPLRGRRRGGVRGPLRDVFAPGRYCDAGGRARGRRRSWIDRRERLCRVVVTAHARTGAIVDLPLRHRVERGGARELRRRRERRRARRHDARAADQRPVARSASDPRRFWHLTLDARGHRVQAALLRLGARLPVAADAPAAAVRRALRRLHGVPEARRRRRSSTPSSCCCGSCCSSSSPRRPARPSVRRRPREPRAQDPVPAPRVPLVARADGALQPRAQPVPVLIFLLARRRRARAGPGSSCRCSSLLLVVFALGLSMLAVGAVRALPRRRADLGRRAADVFYASPILYPIERDRRRDSCSSCACSTRSRRSLQQFRHAVIDPSTPSAASAAGSSDPPCASLAGILLRAYVGSYRYFDREAHARIAEDL